MPRRESDNNADEYQKRSGKQKLLGKSGQFCSEKQRGEQPQQSETNHHQSLPLAYGGTLRRGRLHRRARHEV
jgi:hypothetical protein